MRIDQPITLAGKHTEDELRLQAQRLIREVKMIEAESAPQWRLTPARVVLAFVLVAVIPGLAVSDTVTQWLAGDKPALDHVSVFEEPAVKAVSPEVVRALTVVGDDRIKDLTPDDIRLLFAGEGSYDMSLYAAQNDAGAVCITDTASESGGCVSFNREQPVAWTVYQRTPTAPTAIFGVVPDEVSSLAVIAGDDEFPITISRNAFYWETSTYREAGHDLRVTFPDGSSTLVSVPSMPITEPPRVPREDINEEGG